MKKLFTFLIGITALATTYATPFSSYQLATTSLTNGNVLQTNGTWSTWVATSSIFPSLSGYVPYTGATSNVNLGSFNLFTTGLISSTSSLFTNATSTTFKLSGQFYDAANSAGSAGSVLQSSGGSVVWAATNTLGFVPYIGATKTVDLGSQTLTTTGLITSTTSLFTRGTSTTFGVTNLNFTGITGSFLATDLNGLVIATTSPSGSVSGGTNGFLARWTSATTLSTGIHLDDGTVAGVNATTSTTTLYIKGNAGTRNIVTVASSSGAEYFSVGSGGTTTARDFTATNATSTILNVSSSILMNGTQVMNSSRDLVNINTYTGGTINSQTISNAASFTGSLTTAGAINGSTTISATGNINAYSNIGVSTTSPVTSITVATGSISVSERLITPTSTAMTIPVVTGNTFLIPIGVQNVVITFTNVMAGMSWRTITCAGPATPGTVFFATTSPGITWTSGSLPASTATAKKCDVWSFIATAGTSSSAVSPAIFGAQTPNF